MYFWLFWKIETRWYLDKLKVIVWDVTNSQARLTLMLGIYNFIPLFTSFCHF